MADEFTGGTPFLIGRYSAQEPQRWVCDGRLQIGLMQLVQVDPIRAAASRLSLTAATAGSRFQSPRIQVRVPLHRIRVMSR